MTDKRYKITFHNSSTNTMFMYILKTLKILNWRIFLGLYQFQKYVSHKQNYKTLEELKKVIRRQTEINLIM